MSVWWNVYVSAGTCGGQRSHMALELEAHHELKITNTMTLVPQILHNPETPTPFQPNP